jgi:hypothetical protein
MGRKSSVQLENSLATRQLGFNLSQFQSQILNIRANLHGTAIGTNRSIRLTLDLTSLTILTWGINPPFALPLLRVTFVDSPFIARIAPSSGVNLT